MKALYVCAALIAIQFAGAQTTTQLKDFKTVAINGDLDITLVKGKENKLVILDQEDDVITGRVENGTLKIDGEGSATLFYKGSLEGLSAGADCQVTGSETIKGKVFQLAAGADSEVILNLDVQSLEVAAGADSEVTLVGKAKTISAAIAADSEFNAASLIAEDVTISVAADGEASIKAKGVVNANVSSDAQLTIHGGPKKVNQVKAEDAEITVVD